MKYSKLFRVRMHSLIGLTIIGLILSSCENDLSKLPKVEDGFDFTKDQAKEVNIIISQKASVKSEISAPLLIRNEQASPAYAEMPYGLKAVFYNLKQEKETILTAKYARYFQNTQNIIVQDSVVVQNMDGSMLFTEELIWNNTEQKFYTEQDVYILREGSMAYGEGMEANRDLTEVKIFRQKGVIPVAKGSILPE